MEPAQRRSEKVSRWTPGVEAADVYWLEGVHWMAAVAEPGEAICLALCEAVHDVHYARNRWKNSAGQGMEAEVLTAAAGFAAAG